MKVIVAGSRDFQDEARVQRILNKLYEEKPDIEIVSGLARGPDTFGKKWAESKSITVHKFPAKWKIYGKAAGYRRNEQMAQFADALIAFWDGESRGTMHMINLAREYGLKVAVFKSKL